MNIRPSTEKPDPLAEEIAQSRRRVCIVAVIGRGVPRAARGSNISTRTIAPTGGQVGENMKAPFPLTSRVIPSPHNLPSPGLCQLNRAKPFKGNRTCLRRSATCLLVNTTIAFWPL